MGAAWIKPFRARDEVGVSLAIDADRATSMPSLAEPGGWSAPAPPPRPGAWPVHGLACAWRAPDASGTRR